QPGPLGTVHSGRLRRRSASAGTGHRVDVRRRGRPGPPDPGGPGVGPRSARIYATLPASAPPTRPPPLPRHPALGLVAGGLPGVWSGVATGSRRGGTGAAPPPPPPSPARAEPDPLLADLADARRLLDRYDQTVRAHPALTARLRPLRANHAAHVVALQQAIGVTATPTGATVTDTMPTTATPIGGAPTTGAATAAHAGPGAGVPRDPAAALAALRSLEHAAVSARSTAAVRASGGPAPPPARPAPPPPPPPRPPPPA